MLDQLFHGMTNYLKSQMLIVVNLVIIEKQRILVKFKQGTFEKDPSPKLIVERERRSSVNI